MIKGEERVEKRNAYLLNWIYSFVASNTFLLCSCKHQWRLCGCLGLLHQQRKLWVHKTMLMATFCTSSSHSLHLTFFLLRLSVTENCETQLPVKGQVLTTKEKCNFIHVPGSFLISLQLVTSAKEILYCMTISTGTREIPTSLSTWNTGIKVCAAYSWKTSHSIDLKTCPLGSIQEIAPLPCQMEASSLLFRIQSKMCQLKNLTMFHIANVLHLFKCSHCQSKVK